MTMFTALAGLTARASLHIMITREGDAMRVTVQPKPTGKDGAIPAALVLTATPSELDAGFAAAIAEYQVPAQSLLDQAKAQAATVLEKSAKARDKAKQASEPKAAVKKAAPAKRAPSKPAAPKTAKPAAQKSTRNSRAPRKDALTKDALLAMLTTYLAKLGKTKTPTRADFLKKYPKGRRYERLFTTFEEALAAAQQQDLPLEPPTVTAPETPPAQEAVAPPATETAAVETAPAPAAAAEEAYDEMPALSIL